MTERKLRRRPITEAVDQLTNRSTAITHAGSDQGSRVAGKRSRIGKVIRERAAATGLLPHEILLQLARGEPFMQRIMNPETGEVRLLPHYPDLPTIIDAAKASASYYAPKLSAVQTLPGASDDDLDEFIASAAAEAGVGLGATGEAPEEEGAGDEGGAEPT